MIKHLRTYCLFAVLFAVTVTACSRSHHNELVYRFERGHDAVDMDSLKALILSRAGTEMFACYPDSDVVIIQYDRYRAHQQIIEEQFRSGGYRIELLCKTPVEQKERPWEKK